MNTEAPCVILYTTVMDELMSQWEQVETLSLLVDTGNSVTQVLRVLQWERLHSRGSCSSRNKTDLLPKLSFLGILNYRWVLTWLSENLLLHI